MSGRRGCSSAWASSPAGNAIFAFRYADVTSPPYPTISDGPWLAWYPLTFAGVGVLLHRRIATFLASSWLDGLIGAAAAAAVVVLFTQGLVTVGGDVTVAVLTSAAYPIGDLAILTLLGGALALSGGRLGATFGLLAVGLLVFALGDTIYLERIANDSFSPNSPLNATWRIGICAIGLAACLGARRPEGRVVPTWSALVLPFGATTIALVVLLVDRYGGLGGVASALAAGTILLASTRTALMFREVSQLGEARRQARTDDLTGLGNRRMLYDRLAELAEGPAGGGVRPVALLVIDLDGFKELNDTFGHRAGDLLLAEIGPRLQATGGARATTVRLGGDEFAIVAPDLGVDEAVALGQRVRDALRRPLDVAGLRVSVDASVGVAVTPDHAVDLDGLLACADVAMYRAKRERAGVSVYHDGHDEDGRIGVALAAELREVLEDRLVVHYQPIVELVGPQTGEVRAAEALVRYADPVRGLLAPGQFLAVAEQVGMMRRITRHVLSDAIGQAARWARAGRPIGVAVNLSSADLLDLDTPDHIAALLDAARVPAWRLTLEVSEETLFADEDRAVAVLGRLRALGVALSLDDFGTGFSSLSRLRSLPIDELKIDRSFVSTLTTDHDCAVIVRSIVDLAHHLELGLVAEGVEDAATLDELATLGCGLAQGYFLSRPIPADAFTAWLDARAAPRSRPTPRSWPRSPGRAHARGGDVGDRRGAGDGHRAAQVLVEGGEEARDAVGPTVGERPQVGPADRRGRRAERERAEHVDP